MSRIVATLVYSRQVGSMARKAVLAYFADRANDDGSGIWASKQRIADEIECSKQTVISTINGLIKDKILQEDGHRKHNNGYTVEYSIILENVHRLPETRPDPQEVQNSTGPKLDRSDNLTARGQAALPKPSLNPLPPSEPDGSDTPKGDAEADLLGLKPLSELRGRIRKAAGKPKRARGVRIDPGWEAPPIDDLPDDVRAIVKSWAAGEYERQAAMFLNHWLSSAGANASKRDWPRTWHNWIYRTEERGGTKRAAPGSPVRQDDGAKKGPVPRDGECDVSAKIRARILHRLGQKSYDGWIAPSAVLFDGEKQAVTILCLTVFMTNWIQANLEVEILRSCRDVIGERFGGVRFAEWEPG